MIKSITCRVGNTEWQLVRLDRHDFENISRLGIVGHPAYWTPWIKLNNMRQLVDGEYEVWPRPAPGVEIIPVYEEVFDAL